MGGLLGGGLVLDRCLYNGGSNSSWITPIRGAGSFYDYDRLYAVLFLILWGMCVSLSSICGQGLALVAGLRFLGNLAYYYMPSTSVG